MHLNLSSRWVSVNNHSRSVGFSSKYAFLCRDRVTTNEARAAISRHLPVLDLRTFPET